MTQQHISQPRKLSVLEHAACAWPIIFIVIGGAIGGACGGAAWAVNTRIMSGAMPAPLRFGLIVLSGVVAFVVYLALVFALATAFPGIFAGR